MGGGEEEEKEDWQWYIILILMLFCTEDRPYQIKELNIKRSVLQLARCLIIYNNRSISGRSWLLVVLYRNRLEKNEIHEVDMPVAM